MEKRAAQTTKAPTAERSPPGVRVRANGAEMMLHGGIPKSLKTCNLMNTR